MKLKTYHAPTLHAALRLARIELGSEAVLLEAKEREAETAEARFQVTFALGADGEIVQAPPARLEPPHWKRYVGPTQAPPKSEQQPEPSRRRRSARKPKAVAPERPEPGSVLDALRTPELAAIFGRLVGVGVPVAEATALAVRASEIASTNLDAAALEAGLRETLDAGWKLHSAAEPKTPAARLIALIGPSGAGKSATAVKIATHLQRSHDRPAALVSLGRHPIGGVEPLEAWAILLNLHLEIVESLEDLPLALDRLTNSPRPPGAVILDTPADGSAMEALFRVAGLERHLVLPATHSPADLLRAVERSGDRPVDAVIFTRLDEAAAPGSLWGFQRSTELPISFLGCGAETPGDLYPATAARLTQKLLRR
jgi:flagellar biosynthesis protein FlhF